VIKGFRNFLLRGDVIVLAIGLTVALAFSTLVKAFTDSVINPLIARAQGGHSVGLGVQLGQAGNSATFVNLGAFISAIVYFLIFMAVLYFAVVLPYKHVSAKRGKVVFGDAPATKTCPACLSDDLPAAASKCKYCGTEQPVATLGGTAG
jgi:large conductance mechanosensitive channel